MKKESRIIDCRINGRIVKENTKGKVSIFVKELNCYIAVKAEKVDTPEKKAAYIAKYIELVNECRDRNRD